MSANRVYSKTVTLADDNQHALESSPIKLESAYITATVKDVKFGDVNGQYFTQVVGAIPLFLRRLDASKLYFKNAAAGQNGTVNIIGTI